MIAKYVFNFHIFKKDLIRLLEYITSSNSSFCKKEKAIIQIIHEGFWNEIHIVFAIHKNFDFLVCKGYHKSLSTNASLVYFLELKVIRIFYQTYIYSDDIRINFIEFFGIADFFLRDAYLCLDQLHKKNTIFV